MKICTHCLKNKSNSDFYKRSDAHSKLSSWCKECIKKSRGSIRNINTDFQNKICRKCGQKLILNENWKLSRAKKYIFICNKCENKRASEYHWQSIQQVMAFYSKQEMRCALCGYSNIDCLTIDHIECNGAARRKISYNIDNAEKLVKRNFPDGFRILCRNCQWIEYGKYKKEKKKCGIE